MTSIGVVVHEGKNLGDGLGELRERLAAAGFADPPWRQVAKSKRVPPQVRRLLDKGVDRILVWGGDGTVRRCLDTIVAEKARAELAILPAGTANLLAHGLGIPIDLPGALDVALHGVVRRIDVGAINGERFAVMAGTGFDALMIRDADGAKDTLGRLAYIRAGVRNLDTPPVHVKVHVDGRKWFDGQAACVLVGNIGQIVGGVSVFPDARPDDGRLDVGVAMAERRRDWVRVGLRAITGRIDASRLVEVTQGRKIRVRLDRKLPWELDGGVRSKANKLEVTVLPGRLAICVPAS
jgi:diacylglycerol kinase (ATP)